MATPLDDLAKNNSSNVSSAATLPNISIPTSGGAIRSVDEKFGVNRFSGTGTCSLPIQISPARSGFGPSLSLTYDSSQGNGIFGLGWQSSVPSITRKTSKGLPLYEDADNSDVFIISGAEDLVPIFRRVSGNEISRDKWGDFEYDIVDRDDHKIQRYRPRIEESFTRIERWTRCSDGDVHWRTISQDNVTTIFGMDDNSRIFNPNEVSGGQRQIFSWLVCSSYDSRGNAIVYQYKVEDSAGVDLLQANEFNRSDRTRSANRYIKTIKYGNRTPNRNENWHAIDPRLLSDETWMFKVVFDYGEHHPHHPDVHGQILWPPREDPFSSYLATFEVRTYRLCRRILMFHCFPEELHIESSLVSSMDITYKQFPTASFVTSVSQCSYVYQHDLPERYVKRSLPALDFDYSKVPENAKLAQQPVQTINPESMENIPIGVDGQNYQWTDLDGEGLPGVFVTQGGSWFYKRNISANKRFLNENGVAIAIAQLAPIELLTPKPNFPEGPVSFIDLTGDGRLDLVRTETNIHGFIKHDIDEWQPFSPFNSWPNVKAQDPNFKFVDLTGDGRADILITEDDVFTWYPSLAENGWGTPEIVPKAFGEEQGPRLLLSERSEVIFLVDFSGDGLADLARIRNGEVCYWPNLGYGKFGAKVSMNNAPWFDDADIFSQQRVRLADVDGSGTTDLIYLGHTRVDVYFNHAGNSWSAANELTIFPIIDDLSSVNTVDLLGNGTTCLVWFSKLDRDGQPCIHYIDLMGGQKPHLLLKAVNNLGAETHIRYSPSTRFYLNDKENGTPWITRLPFPVQCVERVETFDRINGNHFVTRYAYHDGFYDGVEREFRGFGMVEQWDTEEIEILESVVNYKVTNFSQASNVPPVHTKVWYHTGVFLDGDTISRQMAHGYYGAKSPESVGYKEFTKSLLVDSVLPTDLVDTDELREAYRALKGNVIRQELYGCDANHQSNVPYVISENNFKVNLIQPRGSNPYTILWTHQLETLEHHSERSHEDPRTNHIIVLDVDDFGNVLRSASVGYGRRPSHCKLSGEDRACQKQPLITYAENDFTNAILSTQDYHGPLPSETRSYQITGLQLDGRPRFELVDFNDICSFKILPFEQNNQHQCKEKRLLSQRRVLYRSDDLTELLPVGRLESLAVPGETYQLAFTPGLLSKVFCRRDKHGAFESLLPNPGVVLEGEIQAGYQDIDRNDHWWIPTGRFYFHPDPHATPAEELRRARKDFFLLQRMTDSLNHTSTVTYDKHKLLLIHTEDAVGNTTEATNNYCILKPSLISDANGNRTTLSYDALGMVVGTALMGKETEHIGDNLVGFKPNLDVSEVEEFFARPTQDAGSKLLGNASSRQIFDRDRYWRSSKTGKHLPTYTAFLTRETHASDPVPKEGLRIQISFSFSDGFGRVIQTKKQASPGPLHGTQDAIENRWVGTGWTVFNNKGKPVKKFEPFFDDTHNFNADKRVGVSSTLFYDPLDRVVATLHPNKCWEKVLFETWRTVSYDANDTVLQADPSDDPDVGSFFALLPQEDYLPTWYESRIGRDLGREEQRVAEKVVAHANTPSISHFDPLGRMFLVIADNGRKGKYETRSHFDILGNVRSVVDARGRTIMRYDYDMIGNRIHLASMDAGERWMLDNAVGKMILSWDSRDQRFRFKFDGRLRPTQTFLQEGDGKELLVGQVMYGEAEPHASANNLRGKAFSLFDQAGKVVNRKYDFKGNLLQVERRLIEEYKSTIDWSTTVPLEEAAYTNDTTYDALNRVVEHTSPDKSKVRREFARDGLLSRVYANLHGEHKHGQPKWTPFITGIQRNPQGMRTLISYGNSTHTTYEYDSHTFNLTRLRTLQRSEKIQDLKYYHDPVGNISHIHDGAQETLYFRNQRVSPQSDYTYDAIYRLIETTGREHLGQVGGQSSQPMVPSSGDSPAADLKQARNGIAMGNYVESYDYDSVGNIMCLNHHESDSKHSGWKRTYTYNEPSQLEDGKSGNILSFTQVGKYTEKYGYDGSAGVHGNMTSMHHLAYLKWDYKDQLQASATQSTSKGGTPETTFYIYDGSGQRMRKVTESHATQGKQGRKTHERIYLGGFEIYRKYGQDGSVSLERETLSVMDDQQRIVVIDTRTLGTDKSRQQLIRFQLDNKLGSATVELDQDAKLISYEEYFPFGSSSYRAVESDIEVPKRYRYTGKERDEENGLYYHGARYYACWLGRWTSSDPSGIGDGVNTFAYVNNDPINHQDPTGNWELTWKGVAIGLAIGVVGIGLAVVTGGVAVPALLGAIAETGVAGAIIADAAGATLTIAGGVTAVKGVADINTTITELRSNKNAKTGADLGDDEGSIKATLLPFQVIASVSGFAGVGAGGKAFFGGGGGGGFAFAGGGNLSTAITTASSSSLTPAAVGLTSGVLMMVGNKAGEGRGGGGSDGGGSSGGDQKKGPGGSQRKPTEEELDDIWNQYERSQKFEEEPTPQYQSEPDPVTDPEGYLNYAKQQKFEDPKTAAWKVFGPESEVEFFKTAGPVENPGIIAKLKALNLDPNKFMSTIYKVRVDGVTKAMDVFVGKDPTGKLIYYAPHKSTAIKDF
jgi:RHS repeat-associated protein